MASCKTVLLLLAALTVTLVSILSINTLLVPSQAHLDPPCSPDEEGYVELSDAVLERFRAGLRIRSVTRGEYHYDEEEMERLVQFIIASEAQITLKVYYEVQYLLAMASRLLVNTKFVI